MSNSPHWEQTPCQSLPLRRMWDWATRYRKLAVCFDQPDAARAPWNERLGIVEIMSNMAVPFVPSPAVECFTR